MKELSFDELIEVSRFTQSIDEAKAWVELAIHEKTSNQIIKALIINNAPESANQLKLLYQSLKEEESMKAAKLPKLVLFTEEDAIEHDPVFDLVLKKPIDQECIN